jgi:hypothetical protein
MTPFSRHAVAMLVVLAITVLVFMSTIAVVQVLGRSRVAQVINADQRLLADLLTASESLAGQWICVHANEVVLPPNGGGITILHDRLAVSGLEGGVQIDCYDCLAMPPLGLIRPGGPLRVAMVLAAPRAGSASEDSNSAPWLEEAVIPDGVRRFPVPLPLTPTNWGNSPTRLPMPAARSSVISLATSVCPQNGGRININTAPMTLLADVYRALSMDGLDGVMRRRRAGERSSVPATTSAGQRLFTLVERSDHWAALITLSTPMARRSWWVVFVAENGKVRVVQRHDADR